MTFSEWMQLGGLALSVLVVVLAQQRSARKISSDIAEKLHAERVHTLSVASTLKDESEKKYQDIFERLSDGQTEHERNVGELGLSLRRYIETVEKEMHKIEIWGRDNYVQKGELTSLRSDLKSMAADIKSDFRDLNAKIDAKVTQAAS